MTQLSKHFSLEEMTKSSTASRMGIDNTPNEEQIENLKAICENILEPLREYYESRPITITSGFRSPELSEAIKSSRNSQHCKGEAVDLECIHASTAEVAFWIEKNLDFDQLILEFYKPGDPNSGWVHVSYKDEGNRKSTLTASKINGKTVYTKGLNV